MELNLQRNVRKYIYDYFISNSIPPTMEQLLKKLSVKRIDIQKALTKLHNDHLIVIDSKTYQILIAHPFAGLPTSFIVTSTPGNNYYATCAWDSIAMHYTLNDNIEIQSYCHYCNRDIRIAIKNKQLSSKEPVSTLVHFQIPANKWWEDIIHTCFNTMNYFCSPDHLETWIQQNPRKEGSIIEFEALLDLSNLLYTNKSDLDYNRPSTEEIREVFTKNGLTSRFWVL